MKIKKSIMLLLTTLSAIGVFVTTSTTANAALHNLENDTYANVKGGKTGTYRFTTSTVRVAVTDYSVYVQGFTKSDYNHNIKPYLSIWREAMNRWNAYGTNLQFKPTDENHPLANIVPYAAKSQSDIDAYFSSRYDTASLSITEGFDDLQDGLIFGGKPAGLNLTTLMHKYKLRTHEQKVYAAMVALVKTAGFDNSNIGGDGDEQAKYLFNGYDDSLMYMNDGHKPSWKLLASDRAVINKKYAKKVVPFKHNTSFMEYKNKYYFEPTLAKSQWYKMRSAYATKSYIGYKRKGIIVDGARIINGKHYYFYKNDYYNKKLHKYTHFNAMRAENRFVKLHGKTVYYGNKGVRVGAGKCTIGKYVYKFNSKGQVISKHHI